ncbi:MAG: UxaA family hydrolase [Candidatus Merdivicinus sp.]|jgi:altronate hydrolase
MDILKIHPADNVAVVLHGMKKGTEARGIRLEEDVPAGHKVALSPIAAGEAIIKYGAPIGTARQDIRPGEWVHTHNLKTGLSGVLEYRYDPVPLSEARKPPRTFQGFRRKSGKAGIRNEIWILPTVGCVNSVAQKLAEKAAAFCTGSVSGVYAFPHPYGCSQLGEDHLNTQKALAGLVRHPNAGGVLVLGLGCENNNIAAFRTILGEVDPERVKFLNCQDAEDEMTAGLAMLRELCGAAAGDRRVDIPASELVIGLKCGGSDGFSGITANPAVGAFSDRLTAEGGTVLLTEVPEMFGAETRLMERCADREAFEQTVELINGFKEYFLRYGQTVYENPSPGNKEGGITTLEDKSLGCTQKSGASAVRGVLRYGDAVERKGLNLLQAPGNDLVASTALAVSGAQAVLFTTGRGTPFGCPVPTIKISSNSALAQKKKGWIDFDAGRILETGDPAGCGEELYQYLLKVASGELQTRNEEHGMRDIAIFKDGVTL